MGVLEKVEFADWAAPIVPVLKDDGNVRICGDYKMTINKASKVDLYPVPRVEDLFTAMSGGVSFSKLRLITCTCPTTIRGVIKAMCNNTMSAPGIFQ